MKTIDDVIITNEKKQIRKQRVNTLNTWFRYVHFGYLNEEYNFVEDIKNITMELENLQIRDDDFKVIQEAKGIIHCILTDPQTNKFYFGYSVCSIYDNYNKKIGKIKALGRAKQNFVHDNYIPNIKVNELLTKEQISDIFNLLLDKNVKFNEN